MKKIALTLTGFALLLLSSCKEEDVDPSLVSTLSVLSAVNGATYEIKVARPVDYFTSTEKYSVIYVLDGDENMDLVAIQSKKLRDSYGGTGVLVVSLGYGKDRSIDYTPSKTNETSGGGPLFLKFMREELIPKIEQEFRADTARSKRVILGHSYGGLFGAYAFAADNTLFGNYILLSPSLWYDSEFTLLLESEHRHANMDRRQLVFMGEGEMENSGRMQAPFDGFYKNLSENYTNLLIKKNRESDLDHMGSKNPNILKGLEFYFRNR